MPGRDSSTIAHERRAAAGPQARLRALFEPRSIAIIGASSDDRRIGGRPLRYLTEAGYDGDIFAVNPNHAEIAGRPAYPSLDSIDQHVDLALVMVPAEHVVGAIEACARKGVGSAVIFSAGFAEVGEEGRAQQQAIRAIVRDAGMSVLGPNCLGAANIPRGVTATFAANLGYGRPVPGTVGVASQSGAVGSHCMELMRARGIGLSKWVTTGNEMDIDLPECVGYLAADPATEVIVGYIEGVRDGDRFQEALAAAQQAGKPVVMLKAGSSEIGAEATQSHTDALAGSDVVYQAVFDRYGVHRATSIDDLFSKAYAFAAPVPRPAGLSVSIVSLAGALERQIDESARASGLASRVVGQPAGGAPADRFVDALGGALGGALAADDGSTLVAFVGSAVTSADGGLVDRVLAAGELGRDRPKAVVGLVHADDRRRLEAAGFLVFEQPDAALASIATVVRHAGAPRPAPPSGNGGDAPVAGHPPSWSRLVRGEMTEVDAYAVLDALGVPVVPHRLAEGPDDAVAAADEVGYPVVVKIVSAAIAHKSDIGGVVVGIADADGVRRAAPEVWERSVRAVGRDRLAGLMVAPMVTGGVEMILGMRRDPVFGPVVVTGVGGRLVEIFGDASVRIPPVDEHEAERMLAELAAFERVRAQLPGTGVGLADLARLIARFSRLAPRLADHADSIEINPLLVGADDRGPIALDALVVPRATTTATPAPRETP